MSATGYDYSPQGKPQPVCKPGEFKFAAVALDHGHIIGQCNGLIDAGAELCRVFDPDPAKVAGFRTVFPQAQAAESLEQVLNDPEIQLIAAAAVPSERGALGIKVMQAGKHYFTDKTPFTEVSQLAEAKRVVRETGKKYMVYYSERLHVESAVFAGTLIRQGAIGRVVHVLGIGPHRLTPQARPPWFFERAKYGGILCDIGSHQIEQFLSFASATDATVTSARIANYRNREYPELEDFGDASLVGDNGATNYFRVDWLNPDGLRTWGDGRTFILGTEGYIELRKYIDLTRDTGGDQVFLVDHKGEQHFSVAGKIGFPFFGELVLDCLNGTEKAMTQEHAFKAAELCLKAQQVAQRMVG
ncbi:MAG: Gfo/Idh/MocA family oxidoreductase [Verrucomicrobia bacterium]|nr:Gfo/Idh/MocA family oxidoreductase [Verrucomicrobiota bacterium]